MSLKGFHVVFIVLAALCSISFAVWVFQAPGDVATDALRTAGWVSGGAGLVLVLYGIWFAMKKSRKIIV